MFGRKGDLYGEFCAASLKMIKALALQGPASGSGVVVPDVDHVYPNTFKALVDFHEGNYLFPSPEQYGILAQQVMAADILGDDSFIQFIAAHLQVPTTCLDVSHTTQEVRMTVRDRLHIRSIVPCLQVASHMMCFQCKGEFLDEENRAVVPCCGRTFHCSCLVYVHSCPYCTVAWGGLRCAECGKNTVSHQDKELYLSFERRRACRMVCCGVDVHPRCKKPSAVCPGCGLSPRDNTATFFVNLRRERRRNERKRRKHKYPSTYY